MRARVVGGRALLLAGGVVLLAALALPRGASAEPEPGARKRGFRLMARATGALTINRVACGLTSAGNICTDSTGSAVTGGGFWPKGTADQYVFNSGLQLAGIIGTDGGPWAGDTAGGFLFDPKGTTTHGEEVQPIYNATNTTDLNSWPGAACVPRGDATADLFHPLLQTDSSTGPNGGGSGVPYCRRSASQGDVWFVSWEGNAALRAGRPHPLGIAVETRGMGWNFPTGNEDILYFIYTFYNVTSTNRADYAAIRQPLADILYQKALDFHSSVAATGVTLPASGYTINPLYAAFAADMDVSAAGANYSSVNLPFALGYVYDHSFQGAQGWTFDPSIFSAPFFPGAGFVGVKYLSSPSGAGEIQLFSNTINGRPFAGAVNDPRDVVQLYRYLSGTLSVSFGDDPCNIGNPALTNVCFVNNNSPQDMRFFQSSTPLSLGPGQGGSIVVAYIFAPPVITAGCGANCDVKPGDPLRLKDAVNLAASGANTVDSLTGFRKFVDGNGNGQVEQGEFTVVPGSLLGKSLVAQAVFNGKFLLPFAPDGPEFFLIPGNDQVTVVWKPSASETAGDPYFTLASQAKVVDPQSGALVNNPLYDPNYRQFDVEGYRIYRGRVDAPNEMTLLAQFDYSGTEINDFVGIVNPAVDCAPEFGLTTSCAGLAPNLKDGTTLTTSIAHDLVGDIIQVKAGADRVLLANGEALITRPDTAVTKGGQNGGCGPKSACPALSNTNVPFVFVDGTPRNNFRYFYAVTAFDVNSIESGLTSLESPRNTKAVTPVRPAGNYVNVGNVTQHIVGRGVAMDTIIRNDPTLDPATGRFSGPSRPANSLVAGFAGQFASQVLSQGGSFSVRLDSIQGGQADLFSCCGATDPGVASTYYLTYATGADTTRFTLSIVQDGNGVTENGQLAFFDATSVDDGLAQRYGGNNSFTLKAVVADTLPSLYFGAGVTTGCRIGGGNIPGDDTCIYNGPRWFDGPTTPTSSPLPSDRILAETKVDPNGGNCRHGGGNSPICAAVDFNNGGELTGVTTVHVPQSYTQLIRLWRNVESVFGPVYRAADMNVYWGAAGKIDSVIDITHNVPIPWGATAGTSWGVLNVANTGTAGSSDNRPTVLTANDLACVEPLSTQLSNPGLNYPCTTVYTFDSVATPGSIAFYKDAVANAATAPVRPNPGFMLYITGTASMFELSGAQPPAQGTVWTLRTYSGMVVGGQGTGAGSTGQAYSFLSARRPMTAVGAEVQVVYDAVNSIRAPSFADLRRVHTVPDPYYVTNAYEQSADNKVIKFVNLPERAIIRIYSSSGVLVNVLEHQSATFGGELTWNVRNRNNQVVASGVYFYHIEANGANGGSARRVGRMTIVNFAQ